MLSRKPESTFINLYRLRKILHRDRIEGDVDLSNLETYRTVSRNWRNEISIRFVGRMSTSSARYQDNLFEANATPPAVLARLGKINRINNGSVEAYIYTALRERLSQMSSGLSLVLQADRAAFALRGFIESFTRRPGLSRSVDKIFEIVVYALFSTLLKALEVKIGVRINNIENTIFSEFSDFTEKVLGLSEDTPERYQDAKVYRVGVTNAADRGIDMWANFGVAIQIKHISMTPSTVEGITSEISADRIIVVCKECERDVLVSRVKTIWQCRSDSERDNGGGT